LLQLLPFPPLCLFCSKTNTICILLWCLHLGNFLPHSLKGNLGGPTTCPLICPRFINYFHEKLPSKQHD
jgi:hypothetical protein